VFNGSSGSLNTQDHSLWNIAHMQYPISDK